MATPPQTLDTQSQQSQDTSAPPKKSIEDFQLPKAILTRIAKNVLPDNTNLQKEAKTALGNAATIFINYLTATATEVMKVSKHKTIQASDVFEALKLIEMQDHIPRLQELLEAHKQSQAQKKSKSKSANPEQDNMTDSTPGTPDIAALHPHSSESLNRDQNDTETDPDDYENADIDMDEEDEDDDSDMASGGAVKRKNGGETGFEGGEKKKLKN